MTLRDGVGRKVGGGFRMGHLKGKYKGEVTKV